MMNQSDSLFDKFFVHNIDLVSIIDKNGIFLRLNTVWKDVLGYEISEIEGRPFQEFLHPDDSKDTVNAIRIIFNTANSKDFTNRFRNINGNYRWLKWRAFSDNDKIYLSARDITERVKNEEILNKFKASIDYSLNGIFWINEESGFDYVNEQACKMLGYSREELLGLKILDIDTVADQGNFRKIWDSLVENKRFEAFTVESKHKRKDGSIFPVELSSVFVWLDNKGLLISYTKDITERKQYEETLLNNQKLLNDSQRVGNIGSWEYYIEKDELIFNDQSHAIFGITHKDQIINFQVFLEYVYPEDRELILQHFEESFKTGVFKEIELRIITQSRKVLKTIRIVGGIEFSETKKPYRSFGIIQDVTEQKKNEEILKLFKFSIDNASEAVFWHNKDAGYEYVNDKACNVLGYTREEFAEINLFDIDPEFSRLDWDNMWEDMQSKKSKGRDNIRLESVHKRKDGSIFPVEVSITHFWIDDKEYHITYVKDITERKRYEKALIESEERARLFVENTPLPIALLDTNMCYIIASKQLYTNYNLGKRDIIGQCHYDIFPDVPDENKALHQRAIKGEVIKCDKEKRIRQDGSVEWYRYELHPWYKSDSTIGGIVAVNEDITERIEATEALKESEQKLQRIFEFAPVSIGLLIDRSILDVNTQVCNITGYTKEELIGEKTQIVFPSQEEYERVGRIMYQQLDEHGFSEFESKWKRKDGRLINVYLALTYINPKEPSKGVLFTAIDITELKQNQEALEKRVLALTRPLDDVGSIEFTDLFNIEELQKLQDSFAKATGVASIITNIDGTPITQPSNFCKLCNLVRSTKKGLRNCMNSDAKIGKINLEGPIIAPCFSAGLWDAGASISLGGVHVANWLIGQVRNKDIQENEINAYADEIGVNREEFSNALNEVNIMSKEQFQATADALYLLANEISLKSFQNFQQARFISEQKAAEMEIRATNEELIATTEALEASNAELEQALVEARKSKALEEANNELRIKENLLKEQQFKLEATNEELTVINEELHKKSDIINAQNEDLKRMLEDLRNTQAKLLHAEKMASLGVLTAGVAHEINNPLNFIMGAYEGIKGMLEKKDYTQRIDLMLDAIKTGVDRTSSIVRSLNQFSRETKNNDENCNVNEIIDNCLIILHNKLENRIEVNKEYSNDVPMVLGNVGNLHQVFINILSNAEQAIEDKGVISIRTVKRKGKTIIEVTDTGSGIEKKNIKQVTDPFFTTKPPGKGTGLGLSIVYNIIKEHNGTIEFESESGKGTLVRVVLPLEN